jgi:beta-phosphoglucomutase-like phosphatase (HAD superfamily)
MRLAGAIFDLDGTLANTLPACFVAFRAACTRLGGPTYTDEQTTYPHALFTDAAAFEAWLVTTLDAG